MEKSGIDIEQIYKEDILLGEKKGFQSKFIH